MINPTAKSAWFGFDEQNQPLKAEGKTSQSAMSHISH
jgi:hypothetical protein